MSRLAPLPRVMSVVNDNFPSSARQLLRQMDVRAVLSRLPEAGLLERLRTVDAIFTDVDGTIVEEGHTALSQAYVRLIAALAAQGVSTTLVTGKPLQEIQKLMSSLPARLPLNVMYEKGAYCLRPDDYGTPMKRYLLSTPEMEASLRDLRNVFLKEKRIIEEKYVDSQGKPLVLLGWAGSGAHESVLSIDILRGDTPENYISLVGVQREALKITDADLLAQLEVDLRAFTERHRSGWCLVHLGNGNVEIAPGPIEKDAAIKVSPAFADARGVLILGDSGNDRKMFSLRDGNKVLAGLVLHREQTLGLVNDADIVSFGMANAQAFLELVLASKV